MDDGAKRSGSIAAALREYAALPKSFWVLPLAMIVNRAGMMAAPFLPIYLTRRFGFAPSDAGAVLSLYGIAAIATSLAAGWLSDRFGPVQVMIGSLVGSGVVLLTMPFVPVAGILLVTVFALAATSEAFRPASQAFVADAVPATQLTKAYSVCRLAINFGVSIGPAVGGVLVAHSFTALFIVDAVTSLLAAAILLFAWKALHATRHTPKEETSEIGAGVALVDSRMQRLVAITFPVLLVFCQHLGPLALFAMEELHLREVDYGLAFTVNTVLVVLLQLPVVHHLARWSLPTVFRTGSVLVAVGFGLFAFVRTKLAFLGCTVVWTLGEIVLLPAISAYVAEIAPPSRRGAYMGFYGMSNSAALALGSWGGAMILDHLGGRALWGLSFGMAMISAVGSRFVFTGSLRRGEVASGPI
jgi:predicted MFS family arabinose efflux permease